MAVFTTLFIFIFGLLIGSFLNVCIYRIPREDSMAYPSSRCLGCGAALRPRDLMPVISYALTGGKCRYCMEKISFRYPIVELITAALFLLIFNIFGFSIEFFLYSIIGSLLIIISGIDLDWQIIPDGLVAIGLACAIILRFYYFFQYKTYGYLLGSILGLLLGGGLLLLIAVLSNGGMGGGDIKLMGMLGVLLGVGNTLLTLLLSFVLGGIIGSLLLLCKLKKRKDAIPFGPFIALAAIITICYSDIILNWYRLYSLR